MRTLNFDFVDDCAVLVHADADPDDEEWSRYVEQLSTVDCTRVLVLTDRASPSAPQRQRLLDRLEEAGRVTTVPTAVLTGSLVGRGVVTAISWFGVKIRAFEPTKLDEALRHLGVDERKHDEVLQSALRLRAGLVGVDLGTLDGFAVRRELGRSYRVFRGAHRR